MILFHARCLFQEAATRASKQQPGSWWCNDGRHGAPEISVAALRVLNTEKVRKVPVCDNSLPLICYYYNNHTINIMNGWIISHIFIVEVMFKIEN